MGQAREATVGNGRQWEIGNFGAGITIGTGSGGNGRQREAMGNRATGGNFGAGDYHWDRLGRQREATGGNGRQWEIAQREATGGNGR